jgi:hypothetical protein
MEPMSFRSLRTSLIAAAFVALVAGVAFARPHPSPSPTPTPPPEETAITTIARREFVAWQAGVVDKNRYAAETAAQLSDAKVSDTSKALSAFGSLVRTVWLGYATFETAPPPGTKAYVYQMVCDRGAVFERLVMGQDGKIDGIFFSDKMDKSQQQ